MLDALANAQGDREVLRDYRQSLSASETLARVQDWASQLKPCRVLALLADNSADWVLADLAALNAQVALLPIPNFFSPTQTLHVLQQTGADAILTDQTDAVMALKLGFVLENTMGSLCLLRRSVVAVALPAGTAKISFTSGSTGTPKGVCLSACGLMATATSIRAQLAHLRIERHLVVLPLTLLLENTAGVYAGLLSGACVHLPALASLGWLGMAGFNPAALMKTTQVLTPQTMILVPELLKAWSLYLNMTNQKAPTSLQFVAVGGARVDPSLLQQARQRGIPAYEGYGMTECGSVVSMNLPGDEGAGVGRPLPHVEVTIQAGEIHLKTATFLGYVDTDIDAEPPTALSANFASGDLGRMDEEGHLHLSGRCKNLLITSFGRNVSPEWVESVLLAQAPIAQALVLGDGQASLSAVLVPFAGVTSEQIQHAVVLANATLPDYARISSWIQSEPFTLQNALATGNGRAVRSTISTRYACALFAVTDQTNHKEPQHVVL